MPNKKKIDTSDIVEAEQSTNWFIYGHDDAKAQFKQLLEDRKPPPWRNFEKKDRRSSYEFQIGHEEKQVVNAAIYLRRPLLVTGDPGTGKTSLAYDIAKQLGLANPLVWPITSRSVLKDALYQYDAIGRLQEANFSSESASKSGQKSVPPIQKYLTLGPLGTAFADSQKRPHILLIDEIDKSDLDLPNDLLHIFEEGAFAIPELTRMENSTFDIRKYEAVDDKDTIPIKDGKVQCKHFPIVVMTSNGERDLPAPFLRRCLRLDMKRPSKEKLEDIVKSHFGKLGENTPRLDHFTTHIMESRRNNEGVANDQLMNAVYLAKELVLANSAQDSTGHLDEKDIEMIKDIVMRSIGKIKPSKD